MQIHSLSYETPEGKRPMRGRDLAKRVKKTSPAQRAALAAWIARGDVSIAGLTRTQTALLTNLNVSNVSPAENATDDDLAALRRGQLSLRDLRAKRWRKPNGVAITDSSIASLIINAGPERVLTILTSIVAAESAPAAAAV